MKKLQPSDPFPECAACDELGKCPRPDVAQDGFGTPMPPDVCLRPVDVMIATEKKHKLINTKNGFS